MPEINVIEIISWIGSAGVGLLALVIALSYIALLGLVTYYVWICFPKTFVWLIAILLLDGSKSMKVFLLIIFLIADIWSFCLKCRKAEK